MNRILSNFAGRWKLERDITPLIDLLGGSWGVQNAPIKIA